MKRLMSIAILGMAMTGAPVMAQDTSDEEAMRVAVASGVCGDLEVLSARFLENGTVSVDCEDATGFVPLLGGLGPVLAGAAGVGALAAAAGGGGSTPQTQ
ncbi:MAG: hypothetical protein GW886_14565 [Rhodobacterales bacterium]|nr:hypothetical protein [Rhodobacterales bacterium]NCT12255.1 hypothetical protein [Rhodobacterales bacterium]